MFLNADIVVKIVMVGLVFASLVTWTVWLAKNLELWKATRNGRAALAVLNEARSLAEANARLGDSSETVARLLRTAVHEVQISPHPDPESLKERVSWLLERVEASASRRIGRGMGLLASIGATAPFVGLFGTVWGIMNSFIGISNAHTTNLAVVAPGIAEALLATALGLFAAIPAVVIYNAFSRAIGGYRALLADGSALVMRLLSRDCERVSARRMSRARRSSAVAIRLGHDGDDFAETHEINVTPFIDVILVLLIIFMIAAPLATVDVPVDLPATTAQRQQRPDKPVFLTIKADRTLAIGDDPVPREALAATLETASHGNHDERIFLRADRAVTYGDVMEVMNALRSAGFLKVALVGLEEREAK